MRPVVTMMVLLLTLCVTAGAWGEPIDKKAAELLAQISAELKQLKPGEYLPQEFVKGLMTDAQNMARGDTRMVAIYGLAFASDNVSLELLERIKQSTGHISHTGMAAWALLLREIREKPEEKKIVLLQERFRKSDNVYEKLMIANTLGSQYLTQSAQFLLEVLEEEYRAGKDDKTDSAWYVVYEVAYHLSKSPDAEVARKTSEVLKSRRLQNRFYGFSEAMAYFMGAITKDRSKEDMSNSLNIIIRDLDRRLQESPNFPAVPSGRREEHETAPIWMHSGVIIAVVAAAGLLIFLLLRRRKAQ